MPVYTEPFSLRATGRSTHRVRWQIPALYAVKKKKGWFPNTNAIPCTPSPGVQPDPGKLPRSNPNTTQHINSHFFSEKNRRQAINPPKKHVCDMWNHESMVKNSFVDKIISSSSSYVFILIMELLLTTVILKKKKKMIHPSFFFLLFIF